MKGGRKDGKTRRRPHRPILPSSKGEEVLGRGDAAKARYSLDGGGYAFRCRVWHGLMGELGPDMPLWVGIQPVPGV